MIDVREAATRKIGPLPVYGWAAVVGGAILLVRLVRPSAGGSGALQTIAGGTLPDAFDPESGSGGGSGGDVPVVSVPPIGYRPPGPPVYIGPGGGGRVPPIVSGGIDTISPTRRVVVGGDPGRWANVQPVNTSSWGFVPTPRLPTSIPQGATLVTIARDALTRRTAIPTTDR